MFTENITVNVTVDDIKARIAADARNDRRAAQAFIRACESGDADQFREAAHLISEFSLDGWRLAFIKVAKLGSVSDEIKNAFLNVWIESKMLPLRCGNRRAMADALRVLMPPYRAKAPMQLFRGAGARERKYHFYGFSWSTRREIARKFAENWAKFPPGGVVLRTVAPPEAILLVREPEDYYDEGEVVVDPFALSKVECVERLAPLGKPPAR